MREQALLFVGLHNERRPFLDGAAAANFDLQSKHALPASQGLSQSRKRNV